MDLSIINCNFEDFVLTIDNIDDDDSSGNGAVFQIVEQLQINSSSNFTNTNINYISLFVDNCEFINCKSNANGGVFSFTNHQFLISVENSYFSNNHASLAGGVFYFDATNSFMLKDNIESYNCASTTRIYQFNLNNCTFESNEAGFEGGAIAVQYTQDSDYYWPNQFNVCFFCHTKLLVFVLFVSGASVRQCTRRAKQLPNFDKKRDSNYCNTTTETTL